MEEVDLDAAAWCGVEMLAQVVAEAAVDVDQHLEGAGAPAVSAEREQLALILNLP